MVLTVFLAMAGLCLPLAFWLGRRVGRSEGRLKGLQEAQEIYNKETLELSTHLG